MRGGVRLSAHVALLPLSTAAAAAIIIVVVIHIARGLVGYLRRYRCPRPELHPGHQGTACGDTEGKAFGGKERALTAARCFAYEGDGGGEPSHTNVRAIAIAIVIAITIVCAAVSRSRSRSRSRCKRKRSWRCRGKL